ncbi:MAG: ABC transporter substrate-binding protein [Pseudonocardiaceae bacterium]|nr:ABC transporter substrate-binding protein [Pseudonocardiaceae bacterium]
MTPRIVSLLPSATEIVCRLGLQDALVGVTHECDHPDGVAGKPALTASRIAHQTMSSAEIDHAVRSQLDGHGSIYDLDETRLRGLAPDLILTQELCEVCAVSYRIVEQAARRLDTEAAVVSLEPNTISDILANIRTVGELTGAQAEADRVVGQLRARLDALDGVSAGLTRRPRALVLEWLEPPFAPGHWVPEQVAHAGGEASFGAAGADSRTTTAEEIRAYDPEVIVLAPCGFDIADTLRQLPRARLPDGWAELPAVRDGDVWAVDATSYFSRPGPRIVDGAEILSRILHPEVFGEPEPHQATRVAPRGTAASA